MSEILLSPEDQDLLKENLNLSSSGYWMTTRKDLRTKIRSSSSEYVHRIVLQRMLLVLPPSNLAVADHINSIRTDNRRENLRLIPQSGNILRKFKSCKNKLGYWRVGKQEAGFEVLFKLDCKTNHFGSYSTVEEAAFWADVYSYRLQYEGAPLNFPEKLEEIREAALNLELPNYPWRRDPYADIP